MTHSERYLIRQLAKVETLNQLLGSILTGVPVDEATGEHEIPVHELNEMKATASRWLYLLTKWESGATGTR